jgi:hypothetical protein
LVDFGVEGIDVSRMFLQGDGVDNPNTTQTPEYTKDKYNAKIIK